MRKVPDGELKDALREMIRAARRFVALEEGLTTPKQQGQRGKDTLSLAQGPTKPLDEEARR